MPPHDLCQGVKVEYQDELRQVEGVRAEEVQGQLVIYGADGKVCGRFNIGRVEEWWIGSKKKPGRTILIADGIREDQEQS